MTHSPGSLPTERLMLLDSASMYFRAFYGVPEKITAPDGTSVNAVRGFLDNIAYLVRSRRPAGLVACMDASWRPAFRVALLPGYKAHRAKPNGDEEVPPALVAQVPIIEECLDALGIARIGVTGYEADDVIGTLASRGHQPVEVVSGDRDLFQVVDDARTVRVLYIGHGVSKLQVVDDEWLRRKYGVSGATYTDFACLRGDPSDGLPGVPGVGERTAADLIRKYGDLAGMLAALDAGTLPKGTAARLTAAREYLEVASRVVTVATDVPLPDHDAAIPAAPADPERLVKLGERWGLDGPLNRLLSAFEQCREP